jgi:hypothetical protein
LSPTPDGLAFTASALERELTVAVAEIEMTDANGNAAAARATIVTENTDVVLTAEFMEGEGNFDWRERRVVASGRVLDVEAGDWGRKPVGARWTIQAKFEVAE